MNYENISVMCMPNEQHKTSNSQISRLKSAKVSMEHLEHSIWRETDRNPLSFINFQEAEHARINQFDHNVKGKHGKLVDIQFVFGAFVLVTYGAITLTEELTEKRVCFNE